MSKERATRFSVGDQVCSISDPARTGQIRRIHERHAGMQYYTVHWGASGTTNVEEDDLEPVLDFGQPTDVLCAGRLSKYPELQRRLTLQRLLRDQPLRNNVFALNASRTKFFPYQFKPLIKFLASPQERLLICDEVGLGKTIEAGLILVELKARRDMRRVLVVCPTNLRFKWQRELRQRFAQDFEIYDSARLLRALDAMVEEGDRMTFAGIVSLETIRTEKVRNALDEKQVPFDLVIIDEAHHLRNFSTAQREAAEYLCRVSQAVIMLTATPVQLGDQNLFSLLNLLDPADFPSYQTTQLRFDENTWIVRAQSAVQQMPPALDRAVEWLEIAANTGNWPRRTAAIRAVQGSMRDAAEKLRDGTLTPEILYRLRRDVSELNQLSGILTRTRRRDVHESAARRRPRAIRVRLTKAEQQFYAGVSDLIRREAEDRGDSALIQSWRVLTPQRRLASCLPAMVEHYREELGVTTTGDDPDGFVNTLSDLDERGEMTTWQLSDALGKLVASWPNDARDSKYEKLRELLRELIASDRNRKIVLFATYKATLRYLARRLSEEGFGSVVVSGDVTDMGERDALLSRFRDDPDTHLLLSSRVGTEGLDFQFCSVLVNYDLPWNPMEVEQRIGRIDRIGQKAESILICNFWVEGTVEQRILERLYERIGVFESSIGDLEAILGDVADVIQRHLVRAALDPKEREQEADRANQVIASRIQEIEHLQSAAPELIGVDGFFQDEVNALRDRKRYVTPAQLRRFVEDYLRNFVPRTRLEYDEDSRRGRLYPDRELIRMLRAHPRGPDAVAIVVAQKGGVEVTFDGDVAFEEPGIEFLNVLHPLVAMIAEQYGTEMQPAAHHVKLKDTTLPPGRYFFFVFRAGITSARAFSSIEMVVTSDDGTVVAEGDNAESILSDIVERGESSLDDITFLSADARRASSSAERSFITRLEAMAEDERATNDAFLEQRAESLRRFYERSIDAARRRLETVTRNRGESNQARGFAAQLIKREMEHDRKLDELNARRRVTTQYENIAAGVLDVR